MIANVSGRIGSKVKDRVVVEIGGVGLFVYVPSPLVDELHPGENVSLYTHLGVREDSLTLYGFATAEERDLFNLVLGVSGVGPRLGLAILSTLTPDAIRRAVFNEQAEIFSRVPGIGKKTAQRMLIFLQDKVTMVEGLERVAAMSDLDTQVLEALIALGYSVVEAQSALQSIPRDAPEDLEERLLFALRHFTS
jgi:Holliday junction DNA helicase RuvA